MESKRLNKKFNSLFWCLIYSMPLFILIITYVGYLNFYKDNQTYNITSEETFIAGESYLSSTVVPNSGYVENIYFNTNLTVDEVVNLLNNITFSIDGVCEPILFSENNSIMIFNEDGVFTIQNDITNDFYFISVDLDLGFIGWNPNIIYPLVIDDILISEMEGFIFGAQNDKLSSLFSITPFEYIYGDLVNIHKDNLLIENTINKDGVEEKTYYSLLDLSLIHTNNTFNGFIFEPLYNTFNDVLPKINFNNESLMSKFVILIFTWFVQGMFLHIIVDTLTLVPKMYHKLMERWLG